MVRAYVQQRPGDPGWTKDWREDGHEAGMSWANYYVDEDPELQDVAYSDARLMALAREEAEVNLKYIPVPETYRQVWLDAFVQGFFEGVREQFPLGQQQLDIAEDEY